MKSKKTLVGYVFKTEADVDKLLKKTDCQIWLDSACIALKRKQNLNVYSDLNMELPERVKVKITLEILEK